MNIRVLLPLVLLSSALALSACGNKGALLPPPAPEDEEWPDEQVDDADADADTDTDTDADARDDAVDPVLDDPARDDDDVEPLPETDVDGEGDDPPPPADDGDGGA